MSALGYIVLMFVGWVSVIFCSGFVIAGMYRVGECWEEGRKRSAVLNAIATAVIAVVGFSLVSLLTSGDARGQCATSTDTLYSGGCIYVDAEPPIMSGQTFTHCWVLVSETDNVEPGFVFVQSPGCGAIAYLNLDYEVWNEGCDSLYASGHLWPFPTVNPTAYLPDTARNYLLCMTWTAGCEQSAYCLTFYSSPLPVTLLSFDGEASAQGILLRWSTGSEQGSSHFVVRRSTDASSWRLVGIVDAALWSQSVTSYSMGDRSPVQGVNYYRIDAVDLDGTAETFRTIAVHWNSESNPGFLWFWTLDGKRLR